MRWWRFLPLLFTFLFSLFTSFVQAQKLPEVSLLRQDTGEVMLPWPVNVQTRLDSLVKDTLFERTQLGLMVYDLSADSVLYSYGGKQALRPASTMKLLTSVAALDLLGSGYAFRTYLYYKGTISKGVLSGDVWLVGGMDPLFDERDMRIFAETIHRIGVDTIRGRIMQDLSFKEEQLLGEGWCWDDENPQLTPLLISGKDEFASQFKDELMKCGVFVDAPVSTGRLPKDKDVLLICSRSHALREVLEPMMKESDNLYAESMFYQIAASIGKRPAEAVHARQLIKQLLTRAGVTGVQYRIADGSGLSLYNYVTPELMIRLLRYAYLKRDVMAALYPSLPVAGVDGTLKKRMTKGFAYENVHAKTGTVSGVSSLAGYCRSANRHLLAFCIINQGVMKNADGRNFQDKVCEAMCKP
ncbi:MAG: D-alanyl-D-alanine carboxypeptidase/D-alanyl-D-alanine-endopeptidase [Prevotella sp.]|nr:D-alanyl-D-alanine carboxypeptidase/D-alanyl-D-alanine-endopeptidase [Prevotella sp.]